MPGEAIDSKLIQKVEEGVVSVIRLFVETHAPQPRDPRLRLAYPLASSRTLAYEVRASGDTTETLVSSESVGRNDVKRVIDALLRWTITDKAEQRILTTHTQVFASRSDSIPAFRFVKTTILDDVKGASEDGCRLDHRFMTIVDDTGICKLPACQCKLLPLLPLF